ncbi:serine hydrolase domain-containing protein [Pseudoxanthomonas composti]|nr:serine hydrolase domain-containing protein [Pseudoxanthomonas composti]
MTSRIACALLLATLSLSALAQARQPVQSAPQAARLDKARLARLDGALQGYVDDGRIAGAVALVLQDGKPVYQRAVGWSDKEARRPMREDTLFRIASQTKAITSTAVLMLVEEGKLTLEEKVSKKIPAFAHTTVIGEDGKTVPAKREITVQDLLTHTAGISYGTDARVAEAYRAKALGPAAGWGWYTADKDEDTCTSMERLASLPFVSQPGEKWVYGYNTDILGCVVERASGMSLEAFIRTRITGPLGMKDTQFFLDPAQRERLAVVYASDADGHAVRAPDGSKGQGHYVDGPRRNFAGGAGLLSTARDYARFLEALRRGGTLDGVRLLSPRSVQLMTHRQTDTYPVDGRGFGDGFEITERPGGNGLDGVGAFGWGGAYGTTYRVDPQSGLVLLLMIQQLPNATDIGAVFPALVYQALD